MTSRRIGRYRLLEVSGTGTFATVHRAEDERLGDVVALKILAENHSLDGEVRERFLREGRAMRRIESDHVVGVHDLGETDQQQPYLVMQYADRGTLAERVRARRAAGWRPHAEDARAVARSLAEAVSAVHRADIVHRDLSPNNVLLRSLPGATSDPSRTSGPLVAPDERLLLADLGLCKDLARHSGLTAAGGTEGFRPPEQRGTPGYISPAADLWSLSALLVWLLTGRTPQDDEDVTDGVTRLGFPSALGDALAAGLVTDPGGRPADAAAWFAAVDGALGPPPADTATALLSTPVPNVPPPGAADESMGSTLPDSSLPPTEPRPVGESPPPSRRQAMRVIVPLTVVVALLLGGLALLGGDGTSVQDLSDDNVLVERMVGDATVAIAGPREVVAGQDATFVADVSGVRGWAWLAPDGTVGELDRLTISTTSPGRAPVTLVAVSANGQLVTVTHELQVVED